MGKVSCPDIRVGVRPLGQWGAVVDDDEVAAVLGGCEINDALRKYLR